MTWRRKRRIDKKTLVKISYIVKIDQRQIKILIAWIEEGLQMFDKGLEETKTKDMYYEKNTVKE